MSDSPKVDIHTTFGVAVLHLHGESAAYIETQKDALGNPSPWTVNRVPVRAWGHLERKNGGEWDFSPSSFTCWRTDKGFTDTPPWNAYGKVRDAMLSEVRAWAAGAGAVAVQQSAEAARMEREAESADEDAVKLEGEARDLRRKAAGLRAARAKFAPSWTAETVEPKG